MNKTRTIKPVSFKLSLFPCHTNYVSIVVLT